MSIQQRAAVNGRRARHGESFGQVSARMLYEVAKRYDEWRGEHYDGEAHEGLGEMFCVIRTHRFT